MECQHENLKYVFFGNLYICKDCNRNLGILDLIFPVIKLDGANPEYPLDFFKDTMTPSKFVENDPNCKHEKIWTDPQSGMRYCKNCSKATKENVDFPEKAGFPKRENGGSQETQQND